MAETLGRRIYALKLRYRIIGLVIESQKNEDIVTGLHPGRNQQPGWRPGTADTGLAARLLSVTGLAGR